jgi:hypothetical protein
METMSQIQPGSSTPKVANPACARPPANGVAAPVCNDAPKLTARGYHSAPRPSIATIQGMVSLRQAVTLDAMVSKSRLHRIAMARHIAMWVARKRGYSTTLIGLEFGDRHHTTVMGATRKIDRRIAEDGAFAARMAALANAPAPPESQK